METFVYFGGLIFDIWYSGIWMYVYIDYTSRLLFSDFFCENISINHIAYTVSWRLL